MSVVLTTERLTLRMPGPSDWAAYRAYRLSDRSTLPAAERNEATARKHFDAFADHWHKRGFGRFIMVDHALGQPIGHVGPHEPEGHPERELSWTLWSAAHEGKGYAFEAARAARDHVFGDLGWASAVSYVVADNLRSQRLALRLGAQYDAAARDPYGNGCLVYRHQRGAA